MVELISLLGLAAGACTTGSFVPQVIKSLKTKETKDLSFAMLVLVVIGIAMWLAYGIVTRDVPIMSANAVSLVLTVTMLGIKIRYG
ncbi:SemiSWEET transporter [Candidatus Woesearchaeota archaeon]|nr:SemiSWEET transporter [Candidatus Woesearchaeota archaeon]MBI2130291.1 SemiSWEET transporter [Candidatus Woesearchaeota archaeon]MBI2661383.1 SemiSWEET transporter [Candidatus Woesearchaeota archaeon]